MKNGIGIRGQLFKVIISNVVFFASSCFGYAASAIDVELDVPSWQFVVGHLPASPSTMSITADERTFAKQVMPLVEQKAFDKALRLFDKQDISAMSAKLRELYGQILLSNKRYDKARDVLSSVIEEEPDLGSAHRALSLAYLMQDALPQARHHLTRCIELGINDPQVFGQLAYTNLQMGRAVTAISGYQQALLLEPDNEQWYQGLLYALIQSNSLAQAESLLTQMLAQSPEDKQLWLQRSQLALKQGNTTKAIGSLETALSLGNNTTANLVTLAKLHIKAGSTTRATHLLAEHSDILLQDTTGEGVSAYVDIATHLVNTQQWQLLAISLEHLSHKTLRLSTEHKSQFDVLHAQLAISKGQNKQALTRLRSALDAVPDNGEALLLLAQIYRKQHRLDHAKMLYIRAQALEETKQRAMLAQAQMAIEQQDYVEALSLLRDVYSHYPSRTDLLQNIAALEKIIKHTA